MKQKQSSLSRKYQRKRQLRQRIVIGGLLIAVCCLLGGIFARYIYQRVTGMSQITAEKFYFTADILGDTCMSKVDGSTEEVYAFTEQSTEDTWYLYGASEHKIRINVQNYYDELRVNEKDITYSGNVSACTEEGKEIVSSSDGVFPVLKVNEANFDTGTLVASNENGKASTELILDIPSYTDWNYTDGTVVTAKISSQTPYKKTLTMKFVLYATDTTMKYEVLDSVGSPYAELVIMTNVNGTIQPYLEWSEALSIDNTNPLTFTYANGTFTQQPGMEDRSMQISQTLQTGRSESIYFFKSDTSKNYSKDITIVNADSSGKYLIEVGK